jgi:hypothetical protein
MEKWTTPRDWLNDEIDKQDAMGLRRLLDAIEGYLSNADIAEEFGEHMEADGYFEGREDENPDYELTFEQAVEVFTKTHLPYVIKDFGEDDVIAKREAWNNWTDAICKNGVITEWQYDNWDNPF